MSRLPVQRAAFVLLLSLALLALVVLAAGLPQMRLSSAWQDLLSSEPASSAAADDALAASGLSDVSGTLLQVMSLSMLILVPMLLVLLLVSAEMRQALLRDLRRVLVFASILAVLYYFQDDFARMLSGERNLGAPVDSIPGIPAFIERPSPLLVFALGVLLLLLVLGGGWLLWRWLRPKDPLHLITLETQNTLADLQSGADFRNRIVRYYYSMCRLLAEERRIERAGGMTPAEFAARLQHLGLAGVEVQQLTRLFERVRYGGHVLNRADELEAMACLTAVIQASAGEK